MCLIELADFLKPLLEFLDLLTLGSTVTICVHILHMLVFKLTFLVRERILVPYVHLDELLKIISIFFQMQIFDVCANRLKVVSLFEIHTGSNMLAKQAKIFSCIRLS